MNANDQIHELPLEAKSPFELRVDQGSHVPEVDVRAAVASGDIGFLHSFTTGSAVDGPGLRVVAWTTGCQFHCQFCHNPDTWKMTNGIPVPLARAIEEVRKYEYGLKVMRGGLTVSGGEPLMQNKFVVKLFAAVHAAGIHTVLDTNGSLGERLSDGELQTIDLVMMSIKAWDDERHFRLVGQEKGPTLAFARRLAAQKRPLWIRYVLVPGLTDDLLEIEHIAAFAGSLGNVERVEVLPFHQMGAFKWEKLRMEYKLRDVQPPSQEAVDHASEIFRRFGLPVY